MRRTKWIFLSGIFPSQVFFVCLAPIFRHNVKCSMWFTFIESSLAAHTPHTYILHDICWRRRFSFFFQANCVDTFSFCIIFSQKNIFFFYFSFRLSYFIGTKGKREKSNYRWHQFTFTPINCNQPLQYIVINLLHSEFDF